MTEGAELLDPRPPHFEHVGHIMNARRHLPHYAMVLPFALLFAAFFLYPIISGFYYSFHDWNAATEARFIGLANYEAVLKSRDFAQMSAAEIARAKQLIAELRLPDDSVPMRRFRPVAQGRSIDLRRTLRQSLRGGGGSIDLAFRERRETHPPVVALVDISGSMAEYSRIFLHFLHTLTARRRRVHSFVFGTRLTNVTRMLKARDPDEALALAGKAAPDWEGGTRISAALHAFNRVWSRRVLAGGAIVLLFTDGLERELDDSLAFEMDRLHRSCRQLVWLNPLLRYEAFAARASGIRAMLPHVDSFRPIHNLAAMADLCAALSRDAGRQGDPRQWLKRAG